MSGTRVVVGLAVVGLLATAAYRLWPEAEEENPWSPPQGYAMAAETATADGHTIRLWTRSTDTEVCHHLDDTALPDHRAVVSSPCTRRADIGWSMDRVFGVLVGRTPVASATAVGIQTAGGDEVVTVAVHDQMFLIGTRPEPGSELTLRPAGPGPTGTPVIVTAP